MSGGNVELVRRAFDAFAERDREALLALMDPEVEFLPVTANLTTGGLPYRGFDGLASYLDDVSRVWDELRVYPSDFRWGHDWVVALGRIRARGGGMIIDRPTGWIWRFKNERIVYGQVFASHEEALSAAGVRD